MKIVISVARLFILECDNVYKKSNFDFHFYEKIKVCNMEPKSITKTVSLIVGFLLSFSFSSCGGGGGGGGGGGNPASPPQIMLSGTVQAPAGQIAFLPQRNFIQQFANVVLPSANALISGLSPVPDGTTVELDRINDAGTIVGTISTTTTSSGNYSFDMTKLGISFSSDLIVRVSNPSNGVQMRAFAGIGITNINPASEASVRIVLSTIAANQGMLLANFTPQEENDIMASVDLLNTLKQVSAGSNIETTVSAIQSTVSADTGVTGFIRSASAVGQTSDGPGDIGNYFPLTVGNTWKYQRTDTKSNGGSSTFTMTSTISGTKIINNTQTFVNTESNYDNAGSLREVYWAKNKTTYAEYGESGSASTLVAQIAPIINAIFPIQPNLTFGQINRTGLDYGQDLDGDGINETVDVSYQAKVSAFETLSTPAGTYNNAARFERTVTLTLHLSKTNQTITSGGPVTEWFAPGVGLIKSIQQINSTGLGQTSQETITDELTVYIPGIVSLTVTPTNLSIAKGLTKQFTATGTFSDNSTQDLTTLVTWASSVPTSVTINSTGLATGLGLGSAIIMATSGSISDSTTLTVTPAVLASIAVTPTSPGITNGTTVQFAATGIYTDNSTQDFTTSVNWSSSNPSVATISNISGSNGLTTSAAIGRTTITAVDPATNISGTTGLAVGNQIGGAMQGNPLSLATVVNTMAGSAGNPSSTDGTGTAARFWGPAGITTDGTNLYVADTFNNSIRKIVISSGMVTTIAGTAGVFGSTDGTGTAASFWSPAGITTDGVNLYVTDGFTNIIRKIVISSRTVTTLAGTAGISGSTDGTGTTARFNGPDGITTDGNNLYVSDNTNQTIRKIVISTGAVTTLAGMAGVSGSADGTGTTARFFNPRSITTDGTSLYVGDLSNNTIRKIVISTGAVTTLAGMAGVLGSADGTGTAARFFSPGGVTTDGTNLYVADTMNDTIRKIQ